MDYFFTIFITIAILTVIALFYNFTLIPKLEKYPEIFAKAGSPSPFWNDSRTWKFLFFVLKGRFDDIPDAELVRSFQHFRIFEIIRMILFVLLMLMVFVPQILNAF